MEIIVPSNPFWIMDEDYFDSTLYCLYIRYMGITQNISLLFILLCFFALNISGYISIQPPEAITFTEEICDNAIDDDNDGLIDLNDPDCECEIIEPTSLIPNPSFEDMDCCPDDRSQLDCAEGWFQASEPTTDYLHLCGWLGWDEFPPPLPFPHGEGIMGFRDGRLTNNSDEDKNWKEYAGACLLSPLKANDTYLFEFHVGFVDILSSPGINITFFGTTDCENLPFGVGNDAFGCPTNGPGWIRLGSTFVGAPTSRWVKSSIEITPEEDIKAIAIGPDCPATLSPFETYYFFDNLVLADLRSFQFNISKVSHPCSEDFTLKVPEEPGLSYQWYKEGIALIGETSTQLSQSYGEGEYQVRLLEDTTCKVSTIYNHTIPVFTNHVVETICEEDVYPFGERLLSETGNYIDTFKTVNNCDSIVSLDLQVLEKTTDTISVKIFEGETCEIGNYSFNNEGDHLARLVSHHGCDSLVYLHLDYYHIFIPNSFSPNNDGVNDFFKVYGGDDLIGIPTLTIFDRWGNQIYNGPQWDGTHQSTFLNPGVFIYVAKVKMDDGLERQFSGSVTLLR